MTFEWVIAIGVVDAQFNVVSEDHITERPAVFLGQPVVVGAYGTIRRRIGFMKRGLWLTLRRDVDCFCVCE